ncbi:transcriptional regulator, LacI family [Celeribacter marinus]|uniref:Putative transcriptional regulator n=2 Tax=Celeribacter marinus TaxID=1397108 RepID=A0A0N9ZEM6_9RHOB|nr:putative transcriptional regulator [Celeribacter marinus]SFK12806.1 transcriptional regulator, LacI family [Celeribacter marinus]
MGVMENNEFKKDGKRQVTMAAVGRLAGVSQVTVSRALSHPDKVSAQTLLRINDAIKVTGFVPNALAGALASKKSNLISALIPSLTNIVYATFITAFSEKLREHGYQILLSETGFEPEAEEALVATHLSRRPDAILLTGIHHSARARQMLLGAGIPIVEVWDITDSPVDMCVGFDHVEAGRRAAEFLFEQGNTRAATITAKDERAVRRQSAFANRFEYLSKGHVAESNTGGPASIRAGRDALSDLIENHGLTSGAVFCSSDLLAQGALIEAQARGIPVPQGISIMGFGDQDFARDVEPSLTTVAIDRTRLGHVTAEALLARINGTQRPKSVTDIGFEIVRRTSA